MEREGAECRLLEKWPLLAGDKMEVVLVRAGQLVRALGTAAGGVACAHCHAYSGDGRRQNEVHHVCPSIQMPGMQERAG